MLVELTADEIALILKKMKNLDGYCKREETYHKKHEPGRTRGFASRIWAYIHKSNMARYLSYYDTLRPGKCEVPDDMAAHIYDMLERECINIMRNLKALYRDDEVRERLRKDEEDRLVATFSLLHKFRGK